MFISQTKSQKGKRLLKSIGGVVLRMMVEVFGVLYSYL